MELSMEKTKITGVREGFDFLGFRVVQTRALRPGKDGRKRYVGNLFIPKGTLNDLRYKIKSMVKATPTGDSLASLIGRLNPVLTGWRNYYRYATWACRDFHKLDSWIWMRIGRWLKKKYRFATWRRLRYRFTRNVRGERLRWADGPAQLRFLWEGGTKRFPHRGIRIPNGWNAEPDEQFRPGADQFWSALKTLRTL